MSLTSERKKPIVNGSVNKDLTIIEMISDYDYSEKVNIAWGLIVGINSAHNYRDIDPFVFSEVPVKYTHDMINMDTVDDILKDMYDQYTKRSNQLRILTDNYHYGLGQKIHKSQTDLGFGGWLTMPFTKLKGYIQAMGSWNGFEHFKVIEGLSQLEKNVPTFYMPNNPNNGMKNHKWYIQSDYITIKFDYLSETDKDLYMKFYKEQWQTVGQTIKADSIRHELIEIDQFNGQKPSAPKNYSLELIFWWD